MKVGKIMQAKASPNTRLAHNSLSAVMASAKHQSAQAPLWYFASAHFFVPVKCCAFSSSGTKNRRQS